MDHDQVRCDKCKARQHLDCQGTKEAEPEQAAEAPAEPTLTPADQQVLNDVQDAAQMLMEAVARASTVAAHSRCDAALAEAKRESQYQQADAQVQRERAERAEMTLALIRTAFDTLPVNKAVSEVLDLLPPVTE